MIVRSRKYNHQGIITRCAHQVKAPAWRHYPNSLRLPLHCRRRRVFHLHPVLAADLVVDGDGTSRSSEARLRSPQLSLRRSVRPEDSRKGRPDTPKLTGSFGGNIGFSGTDIYYALLGQILAVPPAAAERLKQGCGIAQARGARLHDLKGCLQIGLLRGEQNENIGMAG